MPIHVLTDADRARAKRAPVRVSAERREILTGLIGDFGAGDAEKLRLLREMANAEWRVRRSRAEQHRLLSHRIRELATARFGMDLVDCQIQAHEDLLAGSAPFRQAMRAEEKYCRLYERCRKRLRGGAALTGNPGPTMI